jgi:hypothetical protein
VVDLKARASNGALLNYIGDTKIEDLSFQQEPIDKIENLTNEFNKQRDILEEEIAEEGPISELISVTNRNTQIVVK